MTQQPQERLVPTARQRAASWCAYASLALAAVYLAVVLIRRWDVLLAGLAALAVLVVAAWFAVSRRGTPRLVGLVVGAAGLVAFTVVMVASNSVRVLVVGLALAAVSAGSARVALRPPSTDPSQVVAAAAPSHAVLIMNPWSGGGKVERFGLEQLCRDRGIEPIVLFKGSDLLALAEDAVARGADAIGMAGGDGSQAVVASVASRHGIPFVVIPAGTRNHFALDLGIDREDVVGALDAFDDGVDRRIDLAEVNGRVFVNNASMGLYARIVQSAEYRDAKVRTAADTLPDLIGPAAVPLDLRFTLPSGEQATSANLVLVSNNPYQLSHLRGASTRPRLDGGRLGVVSVLVRGAGDAEKLAALEAAGQVGRFSGWNEWTPTEFELTSGGPVEVGVDGEALTMEPPLRFVIRPGALTVRLSRATLSRPSAAPAVHVVSAPTLGALWHTALGRPVVAR
ncbi:MAG TPA: diacylglycerol kinase family protein [Ornithinibacter sp.]|nr:diacylglycerol kinase family protein [Ornithinibacter sp.]